MTRDALLLTAIAVGMGGPMLGCEALIDADFDQPAAPVADRGDGASDGAAAERDAQLDASQDSLPDANTDRTDADAARDSGPSVPNADANDSSMDRATEPPPEDAHDSDAHDGPPDQSVDRDDGGHTVQDADADTEVDGSDVGDGDAGSADDVVDGSTDARWIDAEAGEPCEAGAARCAGNRRQNCGTDGHWAAAESCPATAPRCALGACTEAPSCQPSLTCGPSSDRTSCCATSDVPGGTFARRQGANAYPATVSDYRLDRFEVTVGRFRRFVAQYDDFRAAQGQGAHPRIANSGWQAVWSADVAESATALRSTLTCSTNATWTDSPGINEEKPMDCVSWFEAFLFCIWDGGRLPTDAEWSYAASPSDLRLHPWGDTIDHSRAVYGCGTSEDEGQCYNASYIAAVGSKSPLGDGVFGQSDLGGNVWEWELDGDALQWTIEFPVPCVDCARLATSARRARGGGFYNAATSLQIPAAYGSNPPNYRADLGFRCARDP